MTDGFAYLMNSVYLPMLTYPSMCRDSEMQRRAVYDDMVQKHIFPDIEKWYHVDTHHVSCTNDVYRVIGHIRNLGTKVDAVSFFLSAALTSDDETASTALKECADTLDSASEFVPMYDNFGIENFLAAILVRKNLTKANGRYDLFKIQQFLQLTKRSTVETHPTSKAIVLVRNENWPE